MADFLTRLAERTLGVAPVAQPIIASMFANGRTVPNSPPEAEGFAVQDEVEAPAAPQAPAVHPARPAQSAPSPQTAPTAPLGLTAKFNPTIDAAPQNPRAISRTEPSHQQPAAIVKGSMLPTVDIDSREEHVVIPDQDSNLPDTGGELLVQAERSDGHGGRDPLDRAPGVGWGQHRQQNTPFATSILPGDRRGRLIAPTAAVSARNPDPFPSNFTPPNTGGEMPPQAERSESHGGRDPLDRVPRGWWGQHRQQNAPFATSIPQDVEPPDQDSTLPSDGRLIVPTAALSAHRPDSLPSRFTPIDAQGEQVGRPDGASLGDVVSPRSRGIATPTQQQQETSSRQQADLPLTNEQSGNPADRQRQLTPSLLQNRQVATSQRLPAPVSEAASSTPTIHVTIGRIDVRAVTPPAPPPRPKQARPGPTLSLDDYARQRKGGER